MKHSIRSYRQILFFALTIIVILCVLQISSQFRITVSSQDGSVFYISSFGRNELHVTIDDIVISVELPETICSVDAIHKYSETTFFLCTKEWNTADCSFPNKNICIYRYYLNPKTNSFCYERYHSLSNLNDKILSFLVLDESEHRFSLLTEKQLNYYFGGILLNEQNNSRKYVDQCIVGNNLVVLIHDLDKSGKPIGSRLIKITQYPFIQQIYQKHGILIDEISALNTSELVLLDNNGKKYHLPVY